MVIVVIVVIEVIIVIVVVNGADADDVKVVIRPGGGNLRGGPIQPGVRQGQMYRIINQPQVHRHRQ